MKFEDLILLVETHQVPDDDNSMGEGNSDIDPDFKKDETNLPHGQGFPNAQKKYDKVVRLSYIADDQLYDSDAMEMEVADWLYKTYPEFADKFQEQIANGVQNQGISAWFRIWRTPLNYVEQQILAKIIEYENHLNQNKYFQDNPDDQRNYPLFVTLYDLTRLPGGHEEGGWWYDHYTVVDSVKVNSYKEAEATAKKFYSQIGQADMDGQPIIHLERKSGSQANKTPPTYN